MILQQKINSHPPAKCGLAAIQTTDELQMTQLIQLKHNVNSQRQEQVCTKSRAIARKMATRNSRKQQDPCPSFLARPPVVQRLQKRRQRAICKSHCTSRNLLQQRLQRSRRIWGSNYSFAPIADRSMTLQRFNFLAQTALIIQATTQIPDQLRLCAPVPGNGHLASVVIS